MRHMNDAPSRLAALGLVAGLVLNALPASAQAPLAINIGYQSNVDWLLFVARDLKLFEKAGLAPTFVRFVAGPPMIPAAQEKRIDLTSIGSVPFVVGLAKDVDWVAIGINPEGAYGEGIVAREGSGIVHVADVRGKRIGVAFGSNAHLGLITILKQLGIRRDQVSLVDLPPADQVAALAKKELDAAIIWEPWLRKAVHEAHCRLVVTEGDMGTYSAASVYAARRDWIRDNREAAVRFLRAILDAADVVEKSPTIAYQVLSREMAIGEGWAEDIFDSSPPPRPALWTDPRYRYSLVRYAAFHRRLGHLAALLYEERVIPRNLDLRDALDVSLVEDATKRSARGR